MNDLSRLLDEVLKQSQLAGDMIREASTKQRHIRHKGHNDLVTETDVAVEEALVHNLERILPGSDFLAEESASKTEPGELTWIIDPVDGTTNFAHGLPFVANSIALWNKDRVVLGVVNLPLLGEQLWAIENGGTFLNGDQVHVSSEEKLDQSVLATGFPYAIEKYKDRILKQLDLLLPMTQGIRRPGAAALDLAYVACGRYEGFFEFALSPWDTAAGILLVQEAGGTVTCLEEEAPYCLGAETILATNGLIHSALSGCLKTL